MSFHVDNRTPFACIGFHQYHRDSMGMAALSVRGTFNLINGGKNGGDIRVESEVGKGSVFAFTLPKA